MSSSENDSDNSLLESDYFPSETDSSVFDSSSNSISESDIVENDSTENTQSAEEPQVNLDDESEWIDFQGRKKSFEFTGK